MVPGNARQRHPVIEQRVEALAAFAETFPFNRVEMRDPALGIITCGVAYQYAREVFPDASILKLGMSYPLPWGLIRSFAARVKRLVVLEELDPFIEEQVRLMGLQVYDGGHRDGRAKSIFPNCGEFDPTVVREHAIAAGLLPESARVPTVQVESGPLPARPPVLCPGCPHRAAFYVLNKLKVPVNGDIGCYTLGFVPPLSAMHTCGCMGASIGVAHGALKAGSLERHVAVIGDSTFFHTGLPALLNVAYNRSPVITLILDNRSTGMTGHQDNPGTGRTLQGQETTAIRLEPLVRALGVERVKTVDAYDVKAIEATLKEWLKLDEPAVLICERACALLPEARRQWVPLEVIAERCNGCSLCFRLGCPAILKSDELDERLGRPKAYIDPRLCTGCEVCAEICPREAVTSRKA